MNIYWIYKNSKIEYHFRRLKSAMTIRIDRARNLYEERKRRFVLGGYDYEDGGSFFNLSMEWERLLAHLNNKLF